MKNELNIKWVSELVGEGYLQWGKGDSILINTGTGTGKSHLIKNELNIHCMATGQNILYLTNRDVLKQQVQQDLGDKTSITVLNYQKVEAQILHKVHSLDYSFVVMDEAHYFFTDASFSGKTDLLLPKLLADDSICKIFMTATPTLLKQYIEKEKYKIDYTYELKTNYNYINKIVAFNDYESINSIIEDIPKDEQILLFSTAKRAYEIAKKHNGAFVCSKHNKDGLYEKYVEGTENEEELTNIIENGEFKNHLLCCTTALDNGINIKENTSVKHIIIDILDRDTFIQCLGRKRVGEGEKVNLYFYSWKNDNMRINGFKKRIGDSIERADILLTRGEIEYVNTKFKNDKFVDGRIVDDIMIGEEIHKRVNKCVYLKYYNDLAIYNALLDKKYPLSFVSVIALNLGVDKDDIIEMEVREEVLSLIDALEREVGRRLYKEDQKELIEFINLRQDGKQLKSPESFNASFKEQNIPFFINIPARKSYRDENGNVKKEKSYWIICKVVGMEK